MFWEQQFQSEVNLIDKNQFIMVFCLDTWVLGALALCFWLSACISLFPGNRNWWRESQLVLIGNAAILRTHSFHPSGVDHLVRTVRSELHLHFGLLYGLNLSLSLAITRPVLLVVVLLIEIGRLQQEPSRLFVVDLRVWKSWIVCVKKRMKTNSFAAVTWEVEDHLTEEEVILRRIKAPDCDFEVFFLQVLFLYLRINHRLLPLRVARLPSVSGSPLVLNSGKEELDQLKSKWLERTLTVWAEEDSILQKDPEVRRWAWINLELEILLHTKWQPYDRSIFEAIRKAVREEIYKESIHLGVNKVAGQETHTKQ